MNNTVVYAVRDKTTGKLVSDLTSHSRKFWNSQKYVNSAIQNCYWRRAKDNLEVVAFKLVEIEDDAVTL